MKLKRLFNVVLIVVLSICLFGCNKQEAEIEGTLVTYELNGGNFQNCTTTIKQYYQLNKDVTQTLLKDPLTLSKEKITRANYNFGGWYKDEACTTPWDFAVDKISVDGVTLYAKWDPITKHTYNVCYKDVEGNKVVLGSYEVRDEETAVFKDKYNYANKRSGYTAMSFIKEDGTPWDTSYVHPRPNGENLAVDVYVEYIEGEFTLVSTASDLLKAVNSNIYLLNDIDLEGKEISFGNYTRKIFKGNGFTIKNAVIKQVFNKDAYVNSHIDSTFAGYISLFGDVVETKIEDVTFENVSFKIEVSFFRAESHNKIYVSGVCGSSKDSSFKNVTITGTYEVTGRQLAIMPSDSVSLSENYYSKTATETENENVTVNITKVEN